MSPSLGDDVAAMNPPNSNPRANGSRRDYIDAFLANLSAWDLLYIRNQFRDGNVKIKGLAGLTELPPEVFASIVPHLQLEDVLNCNRVCRSWRETWTQGAVTTALCRRFFPGLLELYGGDIPDRHVLFLAAAKRYLRRHLMRGDKRAFVSWDLGWSSNLFTNHQQPTVELIEDLRQVDFGYSPLTVCYENGKVAWQPGNCYVIVDDLRTRRRHRFTFGIDYISGRPLQLQAVTESLVVLASSAQPFSVSPHMLTGGQTIQVFHLDLLDSKRIALPGKFARCYLQGDMAAFVTKQGHVIVWTWGDKATELEIDHDELHHRPAGWEKDLGGVPGVMFHPTDTDVLYVVWLNSPAPPDPRIHTVVVVKYEDGKPVRRFESSLSHPKYQRDAHSRHSCPAMRFTLSCQKMNPHGLYTVGVAQFVLHEEGSKWERGTKEVEWIAVCFNVLTESFIHYEYETSRRPNPPHVKSYDARVWDDQLIITWFDEYLIGREYPYGMEWLEPSRSTGDDGQRSRGFDKVARRRQIDICEFMLIIGFGRRIFVDEGLLILTTGMGYLVCSWDGEVRLQGFDEEYSRNPPWPKAGERLEPPRLPSLWDCRTVTSLQAVDG